MTIARSLPKFAAALLFVLLLVVLLISIYLAWWNISHASTSARVFKRNGSQSKYFLSFCSRMSNNPIGFPGHGFVIWSNSIPTDNLAQYKTAGFFPYYQSDQPTAIFTEVRGVLVKEPVSKQLTSLDMGLCVQVDQRTFSESLRVRNSWVDRRFKVGTSDCVSFLNEIAKTAKLNTPDCNYVFPQDYVRALKVRNGGSLSASHLL